jgi:hypothetical protein
MTIVAEPEPVRTEPAYTLPPLASLAADVVAATRGLRAALAGPGQEPTALATALPYLGEAAMDIAASVRVVGDAAKVRANGYGGAAWVALYEEAYDSAAHPIGVGASAVAELVELAEEASGDVIPAVPNVLPPASLLEALAAASVEGLSLNTALLAALIVARHHTPPAEAIDLAKHAAFDPRCEDAGAERDRLIEAAGRAWLAAEYGDEDGGL